MHQGNYIFLVISSIQYSYKLLIIINHFKSEETKL